MIMRNEVTYPIALIEMVDFKSSQLRRNFYLKKIGNGKERLSQKLNALL